MIVAWVIDAAVESLFAVSIGSLRLNGPEFWSRTPKVIIDCGISASFRSLLSGYRSEGIYLIPAPPLKRTSRIPGVDAMWTRTSISSLITLLDVAKFGEPVLVCDADTVFLKAPDEFPFPDEMIDLAMMPGWIIHDDGTEAPTPWLRSARLAVPDHNNANLKFIAEQLKFPISQIPGIRSYNSGVFGFRVGSKIHDAWRQAFVDLLKVTDLRNRTVFSPFMAEQNGISLCIHRGTVRAVELPRRFNCFVPIPPLSPTIPEDAVLLHFVNFRRKYRHDAYRTWFDVRERLMVTGFPTSEIPMPDFVKETDGIINSRNRD